MYTDELGALTPLGLSGYADRQPLEQAGCLLDMATDENILGRAFMGWRPWL